MVFWLEWWVWLVAGIVLAGLEVLVPAFVFLGFAGGAALTAALLALGLIGTSLPLILLIFALASLVAWIMLRRFFGVRHGQVKTFDRDINDN